MRVLAIDLDGTALSHPDIVNSLFENPNNFIVIHTARSSALRLQVEESLQKKGIKYHSLVMEKLRADVYIDDKNQGGLQWPEE